MDEVTKLEEMFSKTEVRNLANEVHRMSDEMVKMEARIINEMQKEISAVGRELNGFVFEVNKLVKEINLIRKKFPANLVIDQEGPIPDEYITKRETTVDYILSIIYDHNPNPVSHSDVLRRVYRRLVHKASEFRWIIDKLKQKGDVEEMITDKGIFYKLSEACLIRRSPRPRPLDEVIDRPTHRPTDHPVVDDSKSFSPWDVLKLNVDEKINLNEVIDLTK